MKFYPHPIFTSVTLPKWWRYNAQMPPGVFFYLIPILIALAIPKRYLRAYLLTTSVLLLWLTFGHGFAAGMLAATLLCWLMCLAGRWAHLRGPRWGKAVLIAGTLVSNAIYFSLFATPINHVLYNASHLDVLLFCGPAFMLVRVLGLFSDLCRGQDCGSLRLDRFALFVLFAPTFRLGPVTQYAQLNEQFDTCRDRVNRRMIRLGLAQFAFGLGQLILVTKGIDEWLIDPYRERTFFLPHAFFADAPNLSWGESVFGMYLLAFRFLLGFSGYSHMAIGLCRTIGIELPANFAWPYFSVNLQDFWRRWHVSLGMFLRNYVYVPLGGRTRRALATLVVFVYSFMWHQPKLHMLIFALLHTGGLLTVHAYRQWAHRQADHRTWLWRNARSAGLVDGWSGRTLGVLLTFHFWCVTLLVFFDEITCGAGVLRRIFIDPFASFWPG